MISFDYDAHQLMEKYEARNASLEDFGKRTEYYFKNTRIARTKVKRYRSLQQDKKGTVET